VSSKVLDFEGYVDEGTTIYSGVKNYVRGKTGTVVPSNNTNFNINFIAGDAL
jgi:hypothetical protein